MLELPTVKGVSRTMRWGIGLFSAVLALWAWPSLNRLTGQLVFALLLTALALPLSKRLEKNVNRSLAAALSVLFLMLAVIMLAGLMAPHLISQVSLLIAQAPRLFQRARELWEQWNNQDSIRRLGLSSFPEEWITRAASWAGEHMPKWITGIGAGVDAVSHAFLSPVLAYYFVRDREMFSYQLSLWIPLKYRRRVLTALQEMRREAGGYVRGQSLVALAVALLTAVGLMIVGIPAWLVLGIMMGLCEFIPYIGPMIGGIPIVLFSLPLGISATLWALFVTVFVQQIEGYFLSPRLMAGATGLHPVSVIMLLSAGGYMGGLIGMAAAVPAFVCVRGAARVLYATRGERDEGSGTYE
ncbi:MAG: AI-2E family transporter [Clostridia bacterium]|nr:AI-2E family transporter [Clostridia bacterium]